MTHKSIVDQCEKLGLKVRQIPSDGLRKAYEAVTEGTPHVRVYWQTSHEGGLLGAARVRLKNGHDTHTRSVKEIAYLVKCVDLITRHDK